MPPWPIMRRSSAGTWASMWPRCRAPARPAGWARGLWPFARPGCGPAPPLCWRPSASKGTCETRIWSSRGKAGWMAKAPGARRQWRWPGLARRWGKPVIAVAGALADDVDQLAEEGIDAAVAVTPRPMPLEEAMARAEELLELCGRRLARLVRVGMALARPAAGAAAPGPRT